MKSGVDWREEDTRSFRVMKMNELFQVRNEPSAGCQVGLHVSNYHRGFSSVVSIVYEIRI